MRNRNNLESSLDAITRRINTLERRVARYRIGLASVVVLSVAGLCIGSRLQDSRPTMLEADIVQTRWLRVVDDAGKTRVNVRAGGPLGTIIVSGPNGDVAVRLGELGPLGNGLEAFDSKGRPGITARVFMDENSSIEVKTPSERFESIRISSTSGNGYVSIKKPIFTQADYNRMHDKSTPKTEMEELTARLKQCIDEKVQGLLLSTGGDTGAYFGLNNKTGETVCTMDVDEYGNGRVGAWNRKGNGRTLEPGP